MKGRGNQVKKLMCIVVMICILFFCSVPIFAAPWPEPEASSRLIFQWECINFEDIWIKPFKLILQKLILNRSDY